MHFPMGISTGRFINFPLRMRGDLRDRIFSIRDETDFLEIALEVFNYQYNNNPVYYEFIKGLGKEQQKVTDLSGIPFLPVELFRNQKIISGDFPAEIIFQSSGTKGSAPGRHFIVDLSLYEKSFMEAFRLFYGDPQEYLITALLPSYTEREGSSLVYMADKLIKRSRNPLSGFYRGNTDNLIEVISKSKS